MRNVNALKSAMGQQIEMLDDIEKFLNDNRDVLTDEEANVVTAYLDTVRSPWSVILTACEAVIKKQEAEKEAAKAEEKPKTAKAKAKPKKEAPKPAEPTEEADDDEDWDFLGEED